MEIQLENPGNNAITAYSDTELKINDTIYTKSLFLNSEVIVSDLDIANIDDFNENILTQIMQLKPEIIIFGIKNYKLMPKNIIEMLAKNNIGFEYMHLSSACRTFNVLLSEYRKVTGVFIF